jgi:hypothetical protein
MSCGRLSLFTNVTRDPADTVTVRGETPLDVIVIVAPLVPPPGDGVGDGELGLLSPPPQATAVSNSSGAAAPEKWLSLIRRTSWRY